MLDSSTKIPSGLLQGNIVDIGQYDECVSAHGKSLNVEISGRHCMYSIRLPETNTTIPVSPTFSICVPKSCDAAEVVEYLNSSLQEIDFLNPGFKIDSAECAKIDREVWDYGLILFL